MMLGKCAVCGGLSEFLHPVQWNGGYHTAFICSSCYQHKLATYQSGTIDLKNYKPKKVCKHGR